VMVGVMILRLIKFLELGCLFFDVGFFGGFFVLFGVCGFFWLVSFSLFFGNFFGGWFFGLIRFPNFCKCFKMN